MIEIIIVTALCFWVSKTAKKKGQNPVKYVLITLLLCAVIPLLLCVPLIQGAWYFASRDHITVVYPDGMEAFGQFWESLRIAVYLAYSGIAMFVIGIVASYLIVKHAPDLEKARLEEQRRLEIAQREQEAAELAARGPVDDRTEEEKAEDEAEEELARQMMASSMAAMEDEE